MTNLSHRTGIPIGKIVKPHGLRGEMYVHLPASLNFKDLPKFAVLGLKDKSGERTVFEVKTARPHKDGFLLVLNGVDTIEKAEIYRGHLVDAMPTQFVAAEQKKTDQNFYLFEVLGYTVLDTSGRTVGAIKEFDTSGPQDKAVLTAHGNDFLVPFVKAIIVSRDDIAKQLIMDLPEGLAELNLEV